MCLWNSEELRPVLRTTSHARMQALSASDPLKGLLWLLILVLDL